MAETPATLIEAIRHFSNEDVCREYVAAIRWPNGVACPTCGSLDVTFMPARGIWRCKDRHAKWQFSVKVGTIFEDSPIALDKWLAAMWMLVNDKNGVSSYEVHKAVGVTQATAWFMLQRLRAALEDGTFNKLNGTVEADETYIGGKARNMHKTKREKVFQGATGMTGKAGVMGFIERNADGSSRVRAFPIEDNKRSTIERNVYQHVEKGATLYSDGAGGYRFLGEDYDRGTVDHDANEYVRDDVHTNSIENFWALLKRSLHGTYVSVEPYHLFRYLDEQVFRFNTRDLSDAARFHAAMKGVIGKRLTYAQLTNTATTTTLA